MVRDSVNSTNDKAYRDVVTQLTPSQSIGTSDVDVSIRLMAGVVATYYKELVALDVPHDDAMVLIQAWQQKVLEKF